MKKWYNWVKYDDYELKSELQMPIQRDVLSHRFLWYIWSCELRWWACSPPQLDLLDLSHRTRVYIRGRGWVSSWSGLCLVWTDTYLQIPTERSLDLSWLRYRLNLRRNAGTVCGVSTTYLDLTSAFFFNEDVKDPMVSVCHRCTPVIGILANHTT